MHNLVMTYITYVWESDEPDTEPTMDMGYYEPHWGEWSDYKNDDEHWDSEEVEARRQASLVCVDPDEWDIDEDITLAMKAADFIEDWGCTLERGEWFSGEMHTVDYRTGKEREFSIHFDGDWTEQEKQDVHEELDFREATWNARLNQSYFDSVKAIV